MTLNYPSFGFVSTPVGQIANTIFRPKASAKREKNICFILVPVFPDEIEYVSHLYTKMGESLAEEGFVVYKFEWFGTGNSEGERYESLTTDNLSLLKFMINHVKDMEECDIVGMIGLRWGGTIALEAANQQLAAGPLILWNPILNSKRYVESFLLKKSSEEMLARLTKQNQVAIDTRYVKEYEEKGYSLNLVQKNPRKQQLIDLSNGCDLDLCGFFMPNSIVQDLLAYSFQLSPSFREIPIQILQWGIGPTRSSQYKSLVDALFQQNNQISFEKINAPPYWNRNEVTELEAPISKTLGWLRSIYLVKH